MNASGVPGKKVKAAPGALGKASKVLGSIVLLIVLLEPVWMLLPFAGFLYGSVLNLEVLKSSPSRIWLLYFVFPVKTCAPFAKWLSAAGLIVFLAGAFQVYLAKLRKSGLVTGGIYRISRHPQYAGLILFCVGFMLTWGRILTYLLFGLMTFAYYLLARKEESDCLKRFGADYDRYTRSAPFLFPGDKLLRAPARLLSRVIRPRAARLTIAFVMWLGLGLGLCLSIVHWRLSAIDTPPHARTRMHLNPGRDMDLAVLKVGCPKLVSPRGAQGGGAFWKDVATNLASSSRLAAVVSSVDGCDGVLAFPITRSMRAPKKRKPYEVDFVVLAFDGEGAFDMSRFATSRKHWTIVGGFEVERVNCAGVAEGADPVQGTVRRFAPRHDESAKDAQERVEGLLDIFLTGRPTGRKLLAGSGGDR